MNTTAQIRLWGSNVRQSIAAIEAGYGQTTGLRTARRFGWEVYSYISGVHGKEYAVELLYNIADAIVGDQIFEDIPVWMEHAPETPPAPPVPLTIMQRIRAWLHGPAPFGTI